MRVCVCVQVFSFQTNSREENRTPDDKYHGRTSTPEPTQACQAVFCKLWENKCLSWDTIKQFLAGRLVGDSSHHASALGDLCYKCGTLLDSNLPCKVMFPSTQLGTGDNRTLTKKIGVTEYSNDKGAKPESAGYGSVIPDAPGAYTHLPTEKMGQKVGELVEEYVDAMEELNNGMGAAILIMEVGQTYLQANQFSKLYEEDKACCAIVTRSAAGLVHLVAQMLEPFMPSFSREVFKQLNLPPHFSLSDERGEVSIARRPWKILPPRHKIGTPQQLFEELKGEKVRQRRRKQIQGARNRRQAEEAGNLLEKIRKKRMEESREACSSWNRGRSGGPVVVSKAAKEKGILVRPWKHPALESQEEEAGLEDDWDREVE